MRADSAGAELRSTAAGERVADEPARVADLVLLAADHVIERFGAANVPRDRAFWAGLAAAFTLHALVLIGVGHAVPRMIGDADGSADGISVSVVTEADMRSQSSVAIPAEAAPGPPLQQPAQQPVQQPTQQPVQQPAQPPMPEPQPPAPQSATVETPPPPPELKPTQQPDAEPPSPPVKTPAKTPDSKLETALEKEVPDLLALPGPGAKPQPPKAPVSDAKPERVPAKKPEAAPAAKPPQKRVANLDLTPPPSAFTGGGRGRGAGMERPPGITRSGANDAFARDVIRALQQTMPQLRDVLGRTTVRIILNENGNVVEVQVVRPANNAIDQSVVFAAKQTSYPFPPPNSNLADRTFLVTYIYH